jgi:cyclic pyranopterin phosphate synthase
MIDRFGRRIDYVRLSLTDRCNLRCAYCMSEDMEFLPRSELLSFDEIEALVGYLVAHGTRKLRLTGGEPLVRKGMLGLVRRLGAMVGHGLEELTLTTNGTRLSNMAQDLFDAGIRRLNVSLDTLNPQRFAKITRRVVMRGFNDDEIGNLLAWCGERSFDLGLIEGMPLGTVPVDRRATHVSLAEVRAKLSEQVTLTPSLYHTAGPARYYDVTGTGTRVGFIAPLSDNFCGSCNRIRISATGTVYGWVSPGSTISISPAGIPQLPGI